MNEAQEKLYNIVVDHAGRIVKQYEVKTFAVIAGIYKGIQMWEETVERQCDEIDQLKNEVAYLRTIIQEMEGEIVEDESA